MENGQWFRDMIARARFLPPPTKEQVAIMKHNEALSRELGLLDTDSDSEFDEEDDDKMELDEDKA
jgi:hypothetical protein